MYYNKQVVHLQSSIKRLGFFLVFFLLTSCNSELSQTQIEKAIDLSVTIYHDNDMPKGSGFFIHKDGFIITALHVVEGETILQISQERNRFYPAEVVYKEPRFDLALLKTGLTKEIVSLRLNRMDELQLNDSIYLIGSPLGLNQSLLKGFISVLERTHFDPKYPDIPYIQTYGTSFEGCSGAAVYTYNGKLLGVNRATYGTAFGNSFGLVLPSEFLEIFLNESQKNGVFPGLKYSLFP